MRKIRGASCALAALAAVLAGGAPAQAAPEEKPGSLYLQCDGEPDNMTAGETAVRAIALSAVIGLLAPQPEAADAGKRRLGADGVAACTALLEGERREGNAQRRVGLMLARAVHRIEAKDYAAGLADVALARQDAEASGLTADPYWMRSRGRSFAQIEAAALYRMGKAAEANTAALRGSGEPATLVGLLRTGAYLTGEPAMSEAERQYRAAMTRQMPAMGWAQFDRLTETGDFAGAARVADAVVALRRLHGEDQMLPSHLANAALAHALAGNAARGQAYAEEARAVFDRRRAAGTPASDAALYSELIDLHAMVAPDTGPAAGRRRFGARSQWVEASFGLVVETNRRLRQGASPDELVGALATTPEAMWQERERIALAAELAKDGDNKTLWRMIEPPLTRGAYEASSKDVWRTEKSRLLLTLPKNKPGTTPFEVLNSFTAPVWTRFDAYSLHAALLARARGHKGFVQEPVLGEGLVAMRFITGNPGDPGMAPELFHDADAVIAALSPVIPSPETLKARKQQAAR